MGRNWARVFLLLPLYFTCIHSHGRLMDPPARNSMWRFGFGTPINYRLVFVRSSYSVASINPKYDDILVVELRVQYKKLKFCTCYVHQIVFCWYLMSSSDISTNFESMNVQIIFCKTDFVYLSLCNIIVNNNIQFRGENWWKNIKNMWWATIWCTSTCTELVITKE